MNNEFVVFSMLVDNKRKHHHIFRDYRKYDQYQAKSMLFRYDRLSNNFHRVLMLNNENCKLHRIYSVD
jgi:hypothetical protein